MFTFFFFLILEKLIRSGVGLSHSHEMGIINLMKKRKMQFKELGYWETVVNKDGKDLFIVSNEAT